MFHIRMSEWVVAFVDESCHTYVWVVSYVWLGHVTRVNQSSLHKRALQSESYAHTHTHTHAHIHTHTYMHDLCVQYQIVRRVQWRELLICVPWLLDMCAIYGTHTHTRTSIYIYTYILQPLHTLQKHYHPSITYTPDNSDVYQPPLHTLQPYYCAVRLRLSLREYCALRTSWSFFWELVVLRASWRRRDGSSTPPTKCTTGRLHNHQHTYVYIYTYRYIHIHTYIHIRTCTYIVWIICIYIHMHVYIYIYTYAWIYIHMLYI